LETDFAKPSREGLIEGGHKASNTTSSLACLMERVDPTHHTIILQNNRCENNTHINLSKEQKSFKLLKNCIYTQNT